MSDKPMYCIYLIKNINNDKKYLGWTSNFDKRMRQHYQESYNYKQSAFHTYFHRAIRKYGWHSFHKEIIYETSNLVHIKEMESHFIREYNSHCRYGNGYNMTYGGEGTKGIYRSPKTRENMSKAQKGKKKSRQTLKILHESMLEFGDRIAKEWLVTSPQGETSIIKNLTRFCREQNLDQGNMMKVVKGRSTHCKGWKCERHSSGPISIIS